MKRILGWLIALSMLCMLTACSTTIQKPVPPPQSAFMEALNQALRRLGEDRYPNGLVESEDLCEIARFEEEIYAAMQCTAGKTGTELEAARNQNRKCYRDILKKEKRANKGWAEYQRERAGAGYGANKSRGYGADDPG